MRSPLKTALFVVGIVLFCRALPAVAAARAKAARVAPCRDGCASWPWIALTFSGDGWAAHTIQTVLADLRADLAQRRIDLDLASNRKKGGVEAIAFIEIAKEGANAVAIQVDIPEGGATRRLARVTALDAVPNDGRPLAIALTAGELLRVSWVRIALRRAAEKLAALPPAPSAKSASTIPLNSAASSPSPSSAPPAGAAASAEVVAPAVPTVPSPAGTAPSAAPSEGVPAAVTTVSAGPPSLWGPPSAPQAGGTEPLPTLVETSPSSPVVTRGLLNVGIAVGGAFLVAPPTSTRNVPWAPGVFVRATLSGERIGASLGLLLPAATTLDLGDATARERRYVIDGSFRTTWRGDTLGLAVNLGLFGGYRRTEGVGLIRTSGESGVDWGIHSDITVSLGQARLTPWLGVVVEILPLPPVIAFAPAGNAGTSPTLWVGLCAGMALRLTGSRIP